MLLRPPREARISLFPLVLTLFATSLSVLGLKYNETLDAWNINKNQGE